MTLFYAAGSPDTELTPEDCRKALADVFAQLGDRRRVLAIPPDYTRLDSQAGMLTCLAHELLGDRLVDVLPALGTHDPMSDAQLDSMFPTVPKHLFRPHRWRTDVTEIGRVPGEYVSEVTEGIYDKPWPVEVNKMIAARQHDLILSIGQVVPHEVIGMANYNKNIFVGTGGKQGINESHFIGAAYGMERMMGVADTPLRRILNYAQDTFCADWPLLYVQTVVGAKPGGGLAIRGMYIGDDVECFLRASELSVQVNFTVLDTPPMKFVVWLDEAKFHSTWLGNKAIYRTRMAIADEGELIVLAPGVEMFGEDREIDRLIYKYGYRTTPEVMAAVEANEDLRQNLSAAAHLIHGSPENRFRVTYCPGKLTRPEIEAVGYGYADLGLMLSKYNPEKLTPGVNMVEGEEVYFIPKPALGLWASKDRVP
ncbi:lactate racemase domain-containing protein [Aeoliella sp. SH292]|uniref:lactate racemase domain-containing protein n=1 Tax=Aeoliella sp. SH292 TaxID=3454464 RepID=UPI003F9445D1